jgi:hypothetical protein
MTFNKCSVRGKLYGYVNDEAGNEIQDPEVKVFIFFFDLKNSFYRN